MALQGPLDPQVKPTGFVPVPATGTGTGSILYTRDQTRTHATGTGFLWVRVRVRPWIPAGLPVQFPKYDPMASHGGLTGVNLIRFQIPGILLWSKMFHSLEVLEWLVGGYSPLHT